MVKFLLVQLVAGYGTGVLESGLNVYLAALLGATTLLNRLHAFFGVSALLGPALAAWIVGFAAWTVVWLVLALASAVLAAAFLLAFPGSGPAPEPQMRIMTKDRPEGPPLSGAIPAYESQPPGLMIKLIGAWAAMGFRRPKITW